MELTCYYEQENYRYIRQGLESSNQEILNCDEANNSLLIPITITINYFY
jgi:hypothetical protein